jgi:hypothetical protein
MTANNTKHQKAEDSEQISRIENCQKEFWIGYEAANDIIQNVERVLNFPKKSRMPNLLIIGNTNNGKTSILNRLLNTYSRIENPEGDADIIPLIRVQAPPDADESRLYDLILFELGVPSSPNYRAAFKKNQILTVAPRVNLRGILIDEIHDILAGPKKNQRLFRCVIKQLGSDLKIPIIGAGTIEALNAVNSDPQLSNRFDPLFIPKWKLLHLKDKDKNKEPFLRLLASFEPRLQLQKKSSFGDPKIYGKLMIMCEGLIGELTTVLGRAAETAIQSGEERITLDILEKLKWKPPSNRMNSSAG